MDNIVKLQSREGNGPFTASQNRVTFSIPQDGTWDLANSYVSLMCRINAVGGDSGAIYATSLKYTTPNGNTTEIAPSPACMVKNSRLTSSRFGVMEDIRRPDMFFSNMSSLEMSVADIRGHACEFPVVPFGRGNNKGSVWRELHKEGNVASRDLVSPFKIPLSQFLSLGKSTLDTKALGRLDVYLELQIDRFRAFQLLTSEDNFGNQEYKSMTNISGVGVYNTLKTTTSFLRLEDSPYHIGQSLLINVGTIVGGIDPPVNGVIISTIEWIKTAGDDYGKLLLGFTNPYATFANNDDSWTDITISGRDCSSMEFLVEYAEITLQSSSEKVDMSSGLTYTTITTEEDNGNSLTLFRKQYFLEPECYNVWTCFPDDVDDLRSNTERISKWRLRLDGEDLTNRDVLKGSSLDLDRISMTMLNGGRKLKSLLQVIPDDNSQSEVSTFSLPEAKMICNPVPITAQRKLIDYSIDASGEGVRKIVLFKEVSKTIKM